MRDQSQAIRQHFIRGTDANIALAMEIVEAAIGGSQSRHFLRRSLLRRFNDIKRDALAAMKEMEGRDSKNVLRERSSLHSNHPIVEESAR